MLNQTSPNLRRASMRTFTRAALIAVSGMAIACTGMVDGVDQDVEGTTTHKQGDKHDGTNDNEVLLVSLGASTSAGVTFDPTLLGAPGDLVFTQDSHIAGFAAFLEGALASEVDVYNLAVPGATTSDVLANQLSDALEEISRYSKGAVVTLEGGGNDLRAFQVQYIEDCKSSDPVRQWTCIVELNNTIQTAAANITTAIAAIQAAAPDAKIIVQTQYNSLYGVLPNGAPCADAALLQIANLAFEGNPANNDPAQGLNVALRQVAAANGAGVSDIAGYLYSTGEFTDPSYFGGDCTHLAGTRDAQPAFGMAADTTGKGFGLLQQMYIFAFANL